MNCVDTEHYIQLFVDDELTGPKLREFLKHIEGCPRVMRRWKSTI